MQTQEVKDILGFIHGLYIENNDGDCFRWRMVWTGTAVADPVYVVKPSVFVDSDDDDETMANMNTEGEHMRKNAKPSTKAKGKAPMKAKAADHDQQTIPAPLPLDIDTDDNNEHFSFSGVDALSDSHDEEIEDGNDDDESSSGDDEDDVPAQSSYMRAMGQAPSFGGGLITLRRSLLQTLSRMPEYQHAVDKHCKSEVCVPYCNVCSRRC